jgi:hypothetical protein
MFNDVICNDEPLALVAASNSQMTVKCCLTSKGSGPVTPLPVGDHVSANAVGAAQMDAAATTDAIIFFMAILLFL